MLNYNKYDLINELTQQAIDIFLRKTNILEVEFDASSSLYELELV